MSDHYLSPAFLNSCAKIGYEQAWYSRQGLSDAYPFLVIDTSNGGHEANTVFRQCIDNGISMHPWTVVNIHVERHYIMFTNEDDALLFKMMLP